MGLLPTVMERNLSTHRDYKAPMVRLTPVRMSCRVVRNFSSTSSSSSFSKASLFLKIKVFIWNKGGLISTFKHFHYVCRRLKVSLLEGPCQ